MFESISKLVQQAAAISLLIASEGHSLSSSRRKRKRTTGLLDWRSPAQFLGRR